VENSVELLAGAQPAVMDQAKTNTIIETDPYWTEEGTEMSIFLFLTRDFLRQATFSASYQ
jgi:hypothetical protein